METAKIHPGQHCIILYCKVNSVASTRKNITWQRLYTMKVKAANSTSCPGWAPAWKHQLNSGKRIQSVGEAHWRINNTDHRTETGSLKQHCHRTESRSLKEHWSQNRKPFTEGTLITEQKAVHWRNTDHSTVLGAALLPNPCPQSTPSLQNCSLQYHSIAKSGITPWYTTLIARCVCVCVCVRTCVSVCRHMYWLEGGKQMTNLWTC